MYIVHYWAICSIVGEYLEHCKFDDLSTAKAFASKQHAKVEKI